ncbi:MAG: dihydroorotate dehydrogenase-like protein [Bacteroidales bacterium]|nr:dihydroorotate dehydrogenase-like protein [Bacteroidales bacterium]MCF8327352.1 dihydroorotate dehydrogenase-like protein [Bacteroidales bacterium]
MADLKTNYLGLELKNPIIVGSSRLTSTVNSIKDIESKGAGAVVLKSLFEEQIEYEAEKVFAEQEGEGFHYQEATDYIKGYSKDHKVGDYLKLIKEAKASVDIPIIASVNCVSAREWTSFAKKLEEAGADALELNIFILPSDPNHEGRDNEKMYFEIAEKVKKKVNIPVALKVSYYFSGLAKTLRELSWAGVDGLVLFNRFFSPDIDIDNFKITSSFVFSSPEELAISLRWVAMMSGIVHCDLAASTGIHDGKAVIKQLLAGAKATQVTSILYKSGLGKITEMKQELEAWMDKHGYKTIDEFRGKMSQKEAENPAAFERVQFMKHFSGIE